MRAQRIAVLAAATLAMAIMAGCRVEENKHGDSKDVNIQTPFGGMHVKTDDKAVLDKIGLQAYPGAVAINDDGDDHHSADVDMSFGGFKLRVLAAKYRTDDPPSKVQAFYRSGLRRYGDIIACEGERAVGSPERTQEGLTCSSRKGHVSVDNGSTHTLELKTGSEKHQHLVTIDADGGGTKIGLVALDLPIGDNDSEPADRQ